MIDIPIVWWFVIGQSASLLLLVILCFRLASKISTEKSRAQSRSTRYGQITEQFLPLVQLLKRVLYLYMLLLPYGKFLVLLVKVNLIQILIYNQVPPFF